jgi:hypothetical protein
VKEILENIFEENVNETITYKKWSTKDRLAFETIIKSSEEFLTTLIDKLSVLLLQHSIMASQQSKFLSKVKSTIELGEYVVLCDFAKNCSFILQRQSSRTSLE